MVQKTKRNVTIKDLAEAVGVHHSTVSRALNVNQKSKISPTVVRKIEKMADKLGYYPNLNASSLKHNRSFAIGVLIPDLMNAVFPPIIRGIQDELEAQGYMLITANTDDTPEKEQRALKMMRGRSIDGLIVATAQRNDEIEKKCLDGDIPLVLVNRNIRKSGANAVVSDDDLGIRQTLDHLVSLGHRHIAHVAGPKYTSTGYERWQSFQNNMRAHGLASDIVAHAEHFTIEDGKRALETILGPDTNFTAVVAGNDLIALGCLDALTAAGMRVPDDVSLVGNNDMPLLSRMSPAITTVRIPKYEMGAHAARMLLGLIDGSSTEASVIRLQPSLIVRESTAPVPR